jgi:phosphate starvation-inducible PhoH-like protein
MEVTLEVASQEEAMALFGVGDRNLRLIREALGVQVHARNCVLRLSGGEAPVRQAADLLQGMISLHRGGGVPEHHLDQQLARLKVESAAAGPQEAYPPPVEAGAMGLEGRLEPGAGWTERPPPGGAGPALAEGIPPGPTSVKGIARSRGQAKYIAAILENDVIFCIGPAGTGKTFLAVRMAVNALRAGEVRRLILCRPAVEAGEKLGFLPGDFQAKINPYLRPLYDALNDILDFDQVKRYVEREIIEIIPLAYMRGRTLNNAFIILDEGQNTTISQMKMFLTRMGLSSKIVVNGDVTQVDLPSGQPSGLIHARKVIRGIPGIAWIQLEKADIVRHPLVKRIVEAYEAEPERS